MAFTKVSGRREPIIINSEVHNMGADTLPDDDSIPALPADSSFNTPSDSGIDATLPNELTPSGGGNGQQSSMSLDDFTGIGFDEARDEAERLKLLAPTGDWHKSEEWELRVLINGDDKQQGDRRPEGRSTFLIYGYPDERVDRNGQDWKPFLSMRLSPDHRYHREKTDQPDFAFKLFLSAKDAYLTTHGTKAPDVVPLIKWLVEDEYVINTMNGDSGPFILRVKAKRVPR